MAFLGGYGVPCSKEPPGSVLAGPPHPLNTLSQPAAPAHTASSTSMHNIRTYTPCRPCPHTHVPCTLLHTPLCAEAPVH